MQTLKTDLKYWMPGSPVARALQAVGVQGTNYAYPSEARALFQRYRKGVHNFRILTRHQPPPLFRTELLPQPRPVPRVKFYVSEILTPDIFAAFMKHFEREIWEERAEAWRQEDELQAQRRQGHGQGQSQGEGGEKE